MKFHRHAAHPPSELARGAAGSSLALRTDEVRLEHRREVLALGVEEQAQRRRPQRRCIVHDEPDLADEALGLAGDAMDRVLVGDVRRDRMCLAAAGADARHAVRERPGLARLQHHPRAARGEQLRECAAQAPARAGDQGACSLDLHVVLLLQSYAPPAKLSSFALICWQEAK